VITAATTPTFAEMTLDVYETNKANGWFDESRTFGDDMALTHSEVSEMFEAYRDHGLEDVTAIADAGTIEAGQRLPKPEGIGSEAADVLVRILDTNYRHKVRLKWETLADVEPHPQFDPSMTFGDHIWSLHMLLAYVASENVSLNATVSYLVAFCDHLGIDLQAEFDRKLAYNKTRGYKHGGKRI
jgi:hypothetical protein